MLALHICLFLTLTNVKGESNDLQFLNELSLDKLISLKSSLHELITTPENVTSPPPYLQSFGAQAMALNAPPVKRIDYEAMHKKDSPSKLSKLFTTSVTTLAFLAFGGYLLCLLVQAVKAKDMNNPATMVPTVLISAGIKNKPQSQFASYGRSKRNIDRLERSVNQLDPPADQMFEVLLQLCEGYAKWSERYGDVGDY
ncbi:unnamed protein product [Diatraea saccharalis]|uniref:Uncharacterized protein n=1 Tax=Diatraea saccharalis TaxID=40085 RepID=A0A9N9WEY3_9NEOP|nr:unnamed protein product [Diatraea saccharalis]